MTVSLTRALKLDPSENRSRAGKHSQPTESVQPGVLFVLTFIYLRVNLQTSRVCQKNTKFWAPPRTRARAVDFRSCQSWSSRGPAAPPEQTPPTCPHLGGVKPYMSYYDSSAWRSRKVQRLEPGAARWLRGAVREPGCQPPSSSNTNTDSCLQAPTKQHTAQENSSRHVKIK